MIIHIGVTTCGGYGAAGSILHVVPPRSSAGMAVDRRCPRRLAASGRRTQGVTVIGCKGPLPHAGHLRHDLCAPHGSRPYGHLLRLHERRAWRRRGAAVGGVGYAVTGVTAIVGHGQLPAATGRRRLVSHAHAQSVPMVVMGKANGNQQVDHGGEDERSEE